jgi:hypothetical protein
VIGYGSEHDVLQGWLSLEGQVHGCPETRVPGAEGVSASGGSSRQAGS